MYSFVRALGRYRFIAGLAIVSLCTGCINESQFCQTQFFEQKYLFSIPTELSSNHVQFGQLLKAYDSLNDQQRGAALEHFIGQKYLSKEERAQAAYMLARIYQQNIDNLKETADKQVRKEEYKQTIVLFNQAKNYFPLKERALWHITEIAAMGGEEKLVRQVFNEMLAETNNSISTAAIQYGLAQSYLRANEVEKACDILKKIRIDFPGTDYALGAGYYLATLAYAQLEQDNRQSTNSKQNSIHNQAVLSLKTVLSYYLEYLQASPSGRFTKDILAKLKSLDGKHILVLNGNKLAIIANAYFVNGLYRTALTYWQKAGADKYLFEIAECLVKLDQIQAAEQNLFKGVERDPHSEQYLSIAEQISSKLNKGDAIRFWSKFYNVKVNWRDAVLWQIAIRAPLPQSLNCYQELLLHYPNSVYAPESQWRLVWNKFKSSKAKSLQNVAVICSTAADKYSQSKLAARFLFWTGKIFEILANQQQSVIYYDKVVALYPNDYYGQRSKARLAVIQGVNKDDYFEPCQPLGILGQIWNWPYPENALQELKAKNQATIYTLIYLKQYTEALTEGVDLEPEISSWLLGKTGQPLLAINTAFKYLQEKNRLQNTMGKPSRSTLWQYSFPLLYKQEIESDCQSTALSDPLIMQALIREESRYEPDAISQSKALGLCQLMPATAKGVAKNLGLNMQSNNQLFQPDFNIKLGSAHLSSLMNAFHGSSLLAVASYNAGVNAVKNRIAGKQNFIIKDPDYFVEDFPYRETRDYIRKVFSSYWNYRLIYQPQ